MLVVHILFNFLSLYLKFNTVEHVLGFTSIVFAVQEDRKLWLSSSVGAAELDIEMSCFLLREIGDQFCELLQQEKEAESHHLNEGINLQQCLI